MNELGNWSIWKYNPWRVVLFGLLFNCIGSSEAVEETALESSVMLSAAERQNLMQHRANASVHVCWHRNTSVSAKDIHVALQVTMMIYCITLDMWSLKYQNW